MWMDYAVSLPSAGGVFAGFALRRVCPSARLSAAVLETSCFRFERLMLFTRAVDPKRALTDVVTDFQHD